MKTPDTTSYEYQGDLGFRVVMPCSETLGEAGSLVGAVYGESAALEVFSRADDTYMWRTAPAGDFTVSWAFPEGATKAKLIVEGVDYAQTNENISATSFALSLPAAAEGSENVYSLTLEFDNGTVQTASLGRIRGSVLGDSATIRYAAPNSSAWRTAGKVNVLPVPPGATSLSVDGGDAVSVKGAGYHAWRCEGQQDHSLELAVGEDEAYEATLCLSRGTLVIVR